jgi:hypothetical protein
MRLPRADRWPQTILQTGILGTDPGSGYALSCAGAIGTPDNGAVGATRESHEASCGERGAAISHSQGWLTLPGSVPVLGGRFAAFKPPAKLPTHVKRTRLPSYQGRPNPVGESHRSTFRPSLHLRRARSLARMKPGAAGCRWTPRSPRSPSPIRIALTTDHLFLRLTRRPPWH